MKSSLYQPDPLTRRFIWTRQSRDSVKSDSSTNHKSSAAVGHVDIDKAALWNVIGLWQCQVSNGYRIRRENGKQSARRLIGRQPVNRHFRFGILKTFLLNSEDFAVYKINYICDGDTRWAAISLGNGRGERI
jgi:hypothetical protein